MRETNHIPRMGRASHHPIPAGWRQRLLHRAEGGSMDGGSFGDIIYMPFLIALVLIGMVFAVVGFLRVGASYSVQYSAQVGAVAPEEGTSTLSTLWRGWSNADALAGSFEVDDDERTVTANINTATSYDFSAFGLTPWTFSIGAGGQLHVRSERFYPGAPVCDEGGCGE